MFTGLCAVDNLRRFASTCGAASVAATASVELRALECFGRRPESQPLLDLANLIGVPPNREHGATASAESTFLRSVERDLRTLAMGAHVDRGRLEELKRICLALAEYAYSAAAGTQTSSGRLVIAHEASTTLLASKFKE